MPPRRGAVARRLAAVIVVCIGTTGSVVASAAALEPGVHVDPGSPAGKEYALPVDQARHDSGGSTAQGGSGSNGGQSGLFGAGIGPSNGGGGGGGATGGHAPATAHRPASGTKQHSSSAASSVPTTAGIRASTASGGSSTGAIIGIVAGVLLLGALGGLGARRLRGQAA